MELVYLWVEDYKNIHQQGFNFSPRFKCDYNPNTKKLSIDENDDYIDIFPENINITAIVGENGSGKSVIFKFLSFIVDNHSSNEYILIYTYENNNYYTYNFRHTKKITIQSATQLFNLKDSALFTNHNNVGFIGFDLNSSLVKSFKNNSYPFIERENDKKLLFDDLDIRDVQIKIIENFSNKSNSAFQNETNKFFAPTIIILKLNIYDKLYTEEISTQIKSEYKKSKEYLKQHDYYQAFQCIMKILTIQQTKYKKYSVTNWREQNDEDIKRASLEYKYCSRSKSSQKSLLDEYSNLLEQLSHKEFKDDIFYEWNITQVNQDLLNFLKDLPHSVFTIELLNDKNLKFKNLSYGEQQLLYKLNCILAYSNRLTLKDIETHSDQNGEAEFTVIRENIKIIILIDELELGLHPNWQKKAISYLIDFLKLLKTQFHIIITSHSPFLISDLPQQNMIFLKKDENGNCKVVDGLKEKKQTFGANIHTLLSDSFFMSGGLMGEFAKGKIDTAIQYLNKEKPTPKEIKYCEDIISIIGEPIIKNQLQKMLDSKRLKKVDKIDKIEQDIANLQEELRRLKNDK